jgi:hypothetical protein
MSISNSSLSKADGPSEREDETKSPKDLVCFRGVAFNVKLDLAITRNGWVGDDLDDERTATKTKTKRKPDT